MADDLHSSVSTGSPSPPIPWRRLLLPSEHGSWAFVLEPLLLGLIVACSPAGLWLALAVVLGFIARKPAKFALAPSSGGQNYLRRPARLILAALVAGVSVAVVCTVVQSRWQVLMPLVFSLPALLVFAVREQEGQVRSLMAELIATAMCAIPPVVMALADRWPPTAAYALGLVYLARAWPSLLYVRTYLRSSRHKTTARIPALAAQIAAPLALSLFGFYRILPWAAVIACLALSLRAVYLLCFRRSSFTAKQLGIFEVVAGLVYITAVSAAILLTGLPNTKV